MKKICFLFSAIVICAMITGCDNNNNATTNVTSSKIKITTKISNEITTTPQNNDVNVVAPDVIVYDENGNVIESTTAENELIEVDPFQNLVIYFLEDTKGDKGIYAKASENTEEGVFGRAEIEILKDKGVSLNTASWHKENDETDYVELKNLTVGEKVGFEYKMMYIDDVTGEYKYYRGDELKKYAEENGIKLTRTEKEFVVELYEGDTN